MKIEITQEEYNKKLKEDKFFEDFNEQYEYRFPVVHLFCRNIKVRKGNSIYFIILQEALDDYQKSLVIEIFNLIKQNYGELKN